MHVFIPGWHITRVVCNNCSWAWQCGPTWGWLVRRLLLPFFPGVSIMVGYLPILGLFIFTRCISNTLSFQKNLEKSVPFLGVPLSIVFVRIFPEEDPKLSEMFSNRLCASWIVCPVRSPRGYPLLSLVRGYYECLSGGTYVGSCLSQSSLWWHGIRSSRLGLICDCQQGPRRSSLFIIYFIVLWNRRG